jgi:hypothetical protein
VQRLTGRSAPLPPAPHSRPLPCRHDDGRRGWSRAAAGAGPQGAYQYPVAARADPRWPNWVRPHPGRNRKSLIVHGISPRSHPPDPSSCTHSPAPAAHKAISCTRLLMYAGVRRGRPRLFDSLSRSARLFLFCLPVSPPLLHAQAIRHQAWRVASWASWPRPASRSTPGVAAAGTGSTSAGKQHSSRHQAAAGSTKPPTQFQFAHLPALM